MFSTGKGGLQFVLLNIGSIIYFVTTLYITRYYSAMTEGVTECSTMCIVWVMCLLLKWEVFSYIELLAFISMVTGIFLYVNLFRCKEIRLSEGKQPSEEYLPLSVQTDINDEYNEKLQSNKHKLI